MFRFNTTSSSFQNVLRPLEETSLENTSENELSNAEMVEYTPYNLKKIRWLPNTYSSQSISSGIFVGGSWEEEQNQICLWKTMFHRTNGTMEELKLLCKVPISGSVTGFKMV